MALRLNLRFRAALRFHTQSIRAIAELADVDKNELMDLVSEKRMPAENAPTVLKIAELLGFRPEDCFFKETEI